MFIHWNTTQYFEYTRHMANYNRDLTKAVLVFSEGIFSIAHTYKAKGTITICDLMIIQRCNSGHE